MPNIMSNPESLPLRPTIPTSDFQQFVSLETGLLSIRYLRRSGARRYTMRLHSEREVRVTLPRNAPLHQARSFVEECKPWLKDQLELRKAVRWKEGSLIHLRGELVTLMSSSSGGAHHLHLGEEIFTLTRPPGDDLAEAVKSCMRKIAAAELVSRIWLFSREHRIKIKRVTIRDQRARWGSCSRDGAISLNWRLVQTPNEVRDYVLIHELMHMKQFNHSDAFWRLVSAACPDYPKRRNWLHTHWRLLAT